VNEASRAYNRRSLEGGELGLEITMQFRFERRRARFARRGVFDVSPAADRVVERVVKPSLGGSSEVDDARLAELLGEQSTEFRREVVARTVALPGGRAYLRRVLAARLLRDRARGAAAGSRAHASPDVAELRALLRGSWRDDAPDALRAAP
jgi:hypothetical protein